MAACDRHMECHCACHLKTQDGRPLALHIMPCCTTCPKCGKHVHDIMLRESR